ncbi:ankyrin repeat domain-containing protein [Providencia vermicola]|uniref:Ankyrin repeat domain-containing protein n=2 Tax=Providencia TaxID=586 RepID=A0AAI9MUW9_PROST|nr:MULTISPECIES: ankyrin repeat domain-containing protein [Providencia]ELR5043249.1 ankyrin repeat domain-containing protein [Providencia rettgeri]ELR5035198.1 ankyrin repeat domain-containing protein [Providencia stuartii]ELR5121669.1 ankyrin repeat domain-containing protein [Providencia stuartii]ELR5141081.1 ankyrin repeat domain-containing protein [Providencia stuartii]ELR5290486.1 ankyrin repeat domain-containing protein [Providencia stuartii]
MSSINQNMQIEPDNQIAMIQEIISIYLKKKGSLPQCAHQMEEPEQLSFQQFFGRDPQNYDYLMGLIAYGAYFSDWENRYGVERLNHQQLSDIGVDPRLLSDKATGFEAHICRMNDLYIISFAGSNELIDFYADIRQGIGCFEPQYFQAVNLTNVLFNASKGNMICVGHSLGGGLATFASLASQTPCIGYTPAGIAKNTLRQIGMDYQEAKKMAENGLSRFYVVRYDWLDLLQSLSPFPSALGSRILLDYYDDRKSWRDWLPHRIVTRNFIAHTMPKILKMMCHFAPWSNYQKVVNDDFDKQLEEFSCNVSSSHDHYTECWQNCCENSIRQGNITEFSRLVAISNKTAQFDELVSYTVRSTDPEFMQILLNSFYAKEIKKTHLADNRSYLHLAAQSGRLEQSKVLLQSGFAVNVVDDFGNTPLHDALGSHALSVAEYLLNKGADWRVKNHRGYNCRDVLKNHMVKADWLSSQGRIIRERLMAKMS